MDSHVQLSRARASNGEPAVTVVTTCYNAEPFIEESIRSILSQTFGNLEHVAVDDGSTDGTLRVLDAMQDDRLLVIAAGRVGRGRALNIGLQRARGQYIAIQDADDVSHPSRLAVQIEIMERDPRVFVLGAESVHFGPSRPLKWPPRSVGTHRTRRVDDVTNRIIHYNPLPHTSVVFEKKVLEQIGGYDEGRTALYDWDLYVRLAAAGVSLFKLSIPLVGKRIHSGQAFEAGKRTQYVAEGFKLQIRALRVLGRSPLHALLFPAILGYRLLPRPFRMAVRRFME
jgi:teichuronic acid biosynthesis glycosyltransferase TuaG